MTDPVAAKIIDELLVLFSLERRPYNVVKEAHQYIQQAAREHAEQPVTMSLCRLYDETDPGWRGK